MNRTSFVAEDHRASLLIRLYDRVGGATERWCPLLALAMQLGMAQVEVVDAASRLERDGLIELALGDGHRRALLVRLTARGADMAQRWHRIDRE